jgi:hypothetical protein
LKPIIIYIHFLKENKQDLEIPNKTKHGIAVFFPETNKTRNTKENKIIILTKYSKLTRTQDPCPQSQLKI